MSEVEPDDLVPGNKYRISHDNKYDLFDGDATFLMKTQNNYDTVFVFHRDNDPEGLNVTIPKFLVKLYTFTEIGDPILKGGRRRKKSRRNKTSGRKRKRVRYTKRRRF